MHYVKQFNINGVDTKQVACIELKGVPNAATEGALGVLGVDVISPTHEVYKCVAVNGGVYTWELLSTGFSIIGASVSGKGAATVTFYYDTLIVPETYVVKIGDLVLDTDGYLYQVESIGKESCQVFDTGIKIGTGGVDINDFMDYADDQDKALKTELTAICDDLDSKLSKSIAEVDAIARGAVQGKSFMGYSELVNALNSAEKNTYKEGQHFLVKTVTVPDVWVYGISDTKTTYAFTTEESFKNALVQGTVQVGYYILSDLEHDKVDLTDYAKKSQVPVISATLLGDGSYSLTITMGVT